MLELLYVFLAALAGAMLGGALSVAVGGMGGIRILNRRVTEIEDDVTLLDKRVTTEIKRRAGSERLPQQSLKQEFAELLLANPLPAKGGQQTNIGR